MVVLGSTGSIGTNTLSLAKKFNISIEALSCKSNVALLNEQIELFCPKFVCVGSKELKDKVRHDRVFYGSYGLLEMLRECDSKLVINSLVGFAGMEPSIEIQALGKTLALANKESLVVAGKFLDTKKILPIDSEHFGLKFLLQNSPTPKRLIITASGGAFRDTPLKELKNATPQMALKHPNWSMGAKITIDSATMANKLFEVLEAFWLFDVANIDAIIEPTSTIHAFVDFVDGSTTAHISQTDMKLAIASAVFEGLGKKLNSPIIDNFDIMKLKELKFMPIDKDKYPLFTLKNEVLQNRDLGVIINAANEIFVEKFLNNECKFTDIKKIVFDSLNRFGSSKFSDIKEIFVADKKVREFCQQLNLN